MALPIDTLNSLSCATDKDAWEKIVEMALGTMARPIETSEASAAYSQISNREDEISLLDMYLSNCAWELWHSFENCVERTSSRLASFWAEGDQAKAILILDGLSLRELPMLISGAKAHGFALHHTGAYGSELPGDTTPFANALGFSARASLQNNNAKSNKFPDAFLETRPCRQ